MNGPRSVQAVFLPIYALQLSVVGSGTINVNPAGNHYPSNTLVVLTANPSPRGWTFDHWSGDVTGNMNPVSLTMNGARNAQAVFVETARPVPGSVISWGEQVIPLLHHCNLRKNRSGRFSQPGANDRRHRGRVGKQWLRSGDRTDRIEWRGSDCRGSFHSLALTSDGTVVAWGEPNTVPAGLNDVVAIAAGGGHSLALKNDGTVVAWGSNSGSQSTVPAGLNGVAAIAAGEYHSLALKNDGTVVAWGDNSHGQCAYRQNRATWRRSQRASSTVWR